MDMPRSRDEAVGRLRHDLQIHGWPRSQMTLLVALTGGVGLLASFLLLRAGLDSMIMRYPLALLMAYGVFLLLLWLWLRTKAEDWTDLPDPGVDLSAPNRVPGDAHPAPAWSSGQGGDFGGGASASFDAPAPAHPLMQRPPVQVHGSRTATSDAFDGLGSAGDLGDADEFTIPLLVIVLAAGLALSSLYVVYSAPTLLAELLLDGALSATLYRRLRGIERRHWVSTALRKTVLPFVMTALLLTAVGGGLQSAAPGARSLGHALHQISNRP
jgi:hypothetical protein